MPGIPMHIKEHIALGLGQDVIQTILEVIGGGTINASVQPRSNTLASLRALAGLPGEWGYPTDYPDAMVRFTGVAGQARTFWKDGGAVLTVSVTGADAYTAPLGVSIASLRVQGAPSDNTVTIVLDDSQTYGVFSLLNDMSSGLATMVEDSSGTVITNGNGQAFLRINNSGGAFLAVPIGTSFPV